MAEQIFLAVDMGASSGRHLAGRFDGRRLALEEIHRFDNGPVAMAGRLYWDLPALWSNVVQGLRAAAAKLSGPNSQRRRRYLGLRFRICSAAAMSCWAIPIATATRAPRA